MADAHSAGTKSEPMKFGTLSLKGNGDTILIYCHRMEIPCNTKTREDS